MTYKRILSSLCIIIICMMMFLTGYTKTASINCYADDNWQNVTTNEQLVEAFQAYCKSRDLTIDGSIAGGVTAFTTKTFNSLCDTLGINVTALQADLKYSTDGNIGLKFLFNQSGISAYNRIFSQFLQDNNLSVGDSANQQNNTLFNGHYYTYKNNTALCFEGGVSSSFVSTSNFTVYGSSYKYDTQQIKNMMDNNTESISIEYTKTQTYNKVLFLYKSGTTKSYLMGVSTGSYNNYKNSNYTIYYFNGTSVVYTAYPCVYYDNGKYYGKRIIFRSSDGYCRFENLVGELNITDESEKGYVNVYLTTNNTVINNNTYNGDTIINNNGTHSTDEPLPDDPEVPGYDPYPDGDPNPTPPSDVGGGNDSDDTNITFPNFEFNFPEIDWSLGDLSEKFPFSIPFDLIAFFTVLNAEPEAPSIDADIPLGNWYTWHFEADFSQFDRYASIVRNVEFIGFVVGLIYLTIRLAKG